MKIQIALFLVVIAYTLAMPAGSCSTGSHSCTNGPQPCQTQYPAPAVIILSSGPVNGNGNGNDDGRGVLGGGKLRKKVIKAKKETPIPQMVSNSKTLKLSCLQRQCAGNYCRVFNYELVVPSNQVLAFK